MQHLVYLEPKEVKSAKKFKEGVSQFSFMTIFECQFYIAQPNDEIFCYEN